MLAAVAIASTTAWAKLSGRKAKLVPTSGMPVMAEASISFLGFGDPNQISWGQMLYLAYVTGSIRVAWWWTLPPGLAISLFVISVFLVGRRYERLTGPRRS